MITRSDLLSSMIGMSLEKMWQQEDPLQSSIKIFFLAIVFLAITLVMKKWIVDLMQEMTIWEIEMAIIL